MSPCGAVDAGDAQDDGRETRVRGLAEEIFGFDQDLGGGSFGFGGAGFGDDGAIVLGVDAGAAGVDEFF